MFRDMASAIEELAPSVSSFGYSDPINEERGIALEPGSKPDQLLTLP